MDENRVNLPKWKEDGMAAVVAPARWSKALTWWYVAVGLRSQIFLGAFVENEERKRTVVVVS